MIIDYEEKYNEIFSKVYISRTGTDRDEKMLEKLKQWLFNSVEELDFDIDDIDE